MALTGAPVYGEIPHLPEGLHCRQCDVFHNWGRQNLGQTKSPGAILNRRRRARRAKGRMPGVNRGARLQRLPLVQLKATRRSPANCCLKTGSCFDTNWLYLLSLNRAGKDYGDSIICPPWIDDDQPASRFQRITKTFVISHLIEKQSTRLANKLRV